MNHDVCCNKSQVIHIYIKVRENFPTNYTAIKRRYLFNAIGSPGVGSSGLEQCLSDAIGHLFASPSLGHRALPSFMASEAQGSCRTTDFWPRGRAKATAKGSKWALSWLSWKGTCFKEFYLLLAIPVAYGQGEIWGKLSYKNLMLQPLHHRKYRRSDSDLLLGSQSTAFAKFVNTCSWREKND